MEKIEMKLGNKKVITELCVEQECVECGEPAKYRHTFLLIGARNNPLSKAYGRDDCSWSSDEDVFSCEEHKELVRGKHCPGGMSWCSTFPRERFEHMFLIWKKIDERKGE